MKDYIKPIIENQSGRFAYYISDLATGDILAENHNESFHAASTIKLYYLYEAMRQVDAKILSLDDRYIIAKHDVVGGSGALKLVHTPQSISLYDLLALMIQISDNTATNMLFDVLGMDNINQSIAALGIHNTKITRKLMIVEPGVINYTTAGDLAVILREFYLPTTLTSSSAKVALNILFDQQIDNLLNGKLTLCGQCQSLLAGQNICPNCQANCYDIDNISVKFAHKTGTISGAVHDAGILKIDDKNVIVVVMMDQLSDNFSGHALHREIGLAVYRHYKEEQS